jgi:hypothetical protein
LNYNIITRLEVSGLLPQNSPQYPLGPIPAGAVGDGFFRNDNTKPTLRLFGPQKKKPQSLTRYTAARFVNPGKIFGYNQPENLGEHQIVKRLRFFCRLAASTRRPVRDFMRFLNP